MINLKLDGDWASVGQDMLAKATAVKPAIKKSLRAEAEYLAGTMRANFDKVQPANAPNTVLLKRSSKPLVNHGDLRNSIGVIEGEDEFEFMIGVPAGGEAVKLAQLHEEGAIIVQQMTDKQRRWIHSVLPQKTSGASTPSTGIIVIHIPARPFIQPTFDQEQQRAADRFMQALAKELSLT